MSEHRGRRKLRVTYWNSQSRVVDTELAVFEKYLARLGDVNLVPIDSLDDPAFSPSDLLIVAATKIPDDQFVTWLKAMIKKISERGQIWTPCIFTSELQFDDLVDILPVAVEENWYFDIVSPAQFLSLPIRVANLLRIHDHLHELRRYEDILNDLQAKIDSLETRVSELTKA